MKSNNTLLSVIVPVYNVESYLDRCVQSILNQTYTNLEIILVDDGSTDKSGLICDDYARRDNRIIVIHKPNGGLVSARKAGVNISKGQYATYIDSDDWIEEDAYSYLMDIMICESCDIVTSGWKRDYGSHFVEESELMDVGLYTGIKLDFFRSNMISTDGFRWNVFGSLCNKIYKKEILINFQNHVPNIINMGEDASVVYPMFLNVNSIFVSGKNFYHYCLRNASITGTKSKNDIELLHNFFDFLLSEFSKHSSSIPNIMLQYEMLRHYFLLLRDADSVLNSEGNNLYPFGKLTKSERIVVYGGGRFGKELYFYLNRHGYNVILRVDKAKIDGMQSVECLKTSDFDKVIIGVLVSDIVKEIQNELINLYKIDKERILFVDSELIKNRIKT